MQSEITRYINRLVGQQGRKIRNIIARGIIRMVNDANKMQTCQISVLNGELIDNAERVQQYGFTSYPLDCSECFIAFAGGDRAHPLIFSVDDRRYRIKNSKPGEVIIYTDEGDTITLKRGNTIEIQTKHLVINAQSDVKINTKEFSVNASQSIQLKSAQTAIKTDAITISNQTGQAVEAQFAGGIRTKQDIIAGNISLQEHVHSGVQFGNNNTQSPVG